MKNNNLFIWGIIFVLIMIFYLSSCANKYQATNTFECPIELPRTTRYDTVISAQGDTLLYRRRPRVSNFERSISYLSAGMTIYLLTTAFVDRNKDP